MRSVAFLRGINVGGHRVTKDEFIAVFAALGHTEVDTFLASGNVLFEPGPDGADTDVIAEALEAALGYAVPTTLRTGAEVTAIAESEPFPAATLAESTGKPQVMLLFETPSAAAGRELLALATDDDLLVLDGSELHWLPAQGVSGTELDIAAVARIAGTNTVRTANTLRRLVGRL